ALDKTRRDGEGECGTRWLAFEDRWGHRAPSFSNPADGAALAAADASRSPVLREDEPRPERAERPARTQLERADVDRARGRPRGGGPEVQVARGARHVRARLWPPSRTLMVAPPIVPRKPSLVPLPFRHQRRCGHRDAEEGRAAVRERDGDRLVGEPELRERRRGAALEGEPVAPAARPRETRPAALESADARDRPAVPDLVDGAVASRRDGW